MILEAGANVNAEDGSGRTALDAVELTEKDEAKRSGIDSEEGSVKEAISETRRALQSAGAKKGSGKAKAKVLSFTSCPSVRSGMDVIVLIDKFHRLCLQGAKEPNKFAFAFGNRKGGLTKVTTEDQAAMRKARIAAEEEAYRKAEVYL